MAISETIVGEKLKCLGTADMKGAVSLSKGISWYSRVLSRKDKIDGDNKGICPVIPKVLFGEGDSLTQATFCMHSQTPLLWLIY